MYAFIEGKVCEKSGNTLVLLAGGVGYQLSCTLTTLNAAPATGETMRCHTWLSVRDDAMELFGFATKEEKQMFLLLIGVSGVGPKMALAILSTLSPADLRMAIVMEDERSIARAPGVGKKIAQRIILELKDKLAKEQGSFDAGTGAAALLPVQSNKAGEAAAALAVLGYGSQEISAALKGIDMEALPLEEIIRQSLKKMVK